MTGTAVLAKAYRDNAEREQELAAAATLSQVKQRHLVAAAKWQEIAELSGRIGTGRGTPALS